MLINVSKRYGENLQTLKTDLGVDNILALPRITKVSVNVGLGQNRLNKDMVSYIEDSLGKITGQKPVLTKAKKAIAGFKIRQNDVVGMRVTLRGEKMNDFLNRILNISLPRLRDFRGIDDKGFDKQGNLTIGFKDQVPFAELGHDVLDKPFGLSVTISIKNSNPDKSLALIKTLGFPVKIK
ncbi:50S ribosomal protein L5 [Candidatus Berkelbacteria bacterium]|nr:50S ribosomal protein L5 [Candidatus Berkelbacteria bacterium]